MIEFYKTVGGQRTLAKFETFMTEMPKALYAVEERLGEISRRLDDMLDPSGPITDDPEHNYSKEPTVTGAQLMTAIQELENAERMHDETAGDLAEADSTPSETSVEEIEEGDMAVFPRTPAMNQQREAPPSEEEQLEAMKDEFTEKLKELADEEK